MSYACKSSNNETTYRGRRQPQTRLTLSLSMVVDFFGLRMEAPYSLGNIMSNSMHNSPSGMSSFEQHFLTTASARCTQLRHLTITNAFTMVQQCCAAATTLTNSERKRQMMHMAKPPVTQQQQSVPFSESANIHRSTMAILLCFLRHAAENRILFCLIRSSMTMAFENWKRPASWKEC